MVFTTIKIIKRPIDEVWISMRDDLTKIVHSLEDIKEVRMQSHERQSDILRIVNVWTASPKLPLGLEKYLGSDMFVWTDRAEWNASNKECRWIIEPHMFQAQIRCSGSTRFEPALGGRGTRITFSGRLEWADQKPFGMPNVLGDTVIKGIEVLTGDLIPRNFRKIADAIEAYLLKA